MTPAPFLLSFLEKRVGEMEQQRQLELQTVQREKEQLQAVIAGQTAIIGELRHQLLHVSSNNTALQRQQQELLDTVNNLAQSFSAGPVQGGCTARQRGPRKNMLLPTLFSRLSRWSPERTRCTYFLLSHMQRAGNVFSSCFLNVTGDLFNARPAVVIKEGKGLMLKRCIFIQCMMCLLLLQRANG